MSELIIRAYGKPAPQGSKKAYVVNGKARMTEQSPGLPAWRTAVVDAAMAARFKEGWETLSGAAHVAIVFYVDRPASISVKKRPYPTVAPDVDKLTRGVLDSLTIANVFKDDAQVVNLLVAKRYSDGTPEMAQGCLITVQEFS